MITGELRNKIDQIWLEFWQGGITNPLTVIEQITYLIFIRLLDIEETRQESRANRTGKTYKGHFQGKDDLNRWGNLRKIASADAAARIRDEVFPHIKTIAGESSTFGKYMSDATFMINKPELLQKVMGLIDELPLDRGDLKGDIYEYLLGKLTTAGINGQFRTPRHIIRLMVEIMAPKLTDKVADPSCGTAGFLCEVINYLNKQHSSEDGVLEQEEAGKIYKSYLGDLIEPADRDFMRSDMLSGFDFDESMLRVSAMNLMLHGIDNPHVRYADTLSKSFPEQYPDLEEGAFDLVLANPPFKGSVDNELLDGTLVNKVKTKKTELLFLIRIWKMLKLGGRCAVIVPDGVLFGASKAHLAVRKLLVENNQLEAVISLPSGVFKPYAGVKTGILIFTKGDLATEGQTERVLFFDCKSDGYSLDDKRQEVKENDTAEIPGLWAKWASGDGHAAFEDKTEKKDGLTAFYVTADELRKENYDLSVNRYKEVVYEAVAYDPPLEILKSIQAMEKDIAKGLKDLEGMLK